MKMELNPKFKQWKPRTIERWRKTAIEGFEATGHTTHSGQAMMVPFMVNYCEENNIPYKLTAYPGQGYYVERIPPL